MINERELMIGNWVYLEGRIHDLDAFDIYKISEGNDGSVTPIQLTEEILLNSGFKKNPISKEFSFTVFELNHFQVFLDDDGFYLAHNDKYTPLPHVHQLQNAYYILNDYKELDIKL